VGGRVGGWVAAAVLVFHGGGRQTDGRVAVVALLKWPAWSGSGPLRLQSKGGACRGGGQGII